MIKLLVIHGPNLNLLGRREKNIYGATTLEEINKQIGDLIAEENGELKVFQSNHEGVIVDTIQEWGGWADFLVINPGAFTHTSVAIRDAILATSVSTIEVHLSNIYRREAFRQHSYIADIAVGQISGLGPLGYSLAVQASLALKAVAPR